MQDSSVRLMQICYF